MSAKPSPPKLNRDGLKEFRSSTDDKAELIALASRFETYQTSLKTHELTTTFIAFEALAAFCGGRLEGYSDEDLQTTWPKDWGSDAAKVPFTLLMALSRAWMKYQTSPKGTTLGEAFGLEGGGQGRQRIKDRQATRDKHKKLSNKVLIEYLSPEGRISVENAIAIVAEAEDVPFKTVERAYHECAPETRKRLARFGII